MRSNYDNSWYGALIERSVSEINVLGWARKRHTYRHNSLIFKSSMQAIHSFHDVSRTLSNSINTPSKSSSSRINRTGSHTTADHGHPEQIRIGTSLPSHAPVKKARIRGEGGGIDGKGIARIHGFMSFHVLFQCKRYKGSVAANEVRDFRGAMVVTIVGGFSTALALARASDLIASVPERHAGNLRAGMHSFPLPVATPEITVSLLWHPRLDADPAHRWLRAHVRDVCAALRQEA